MTGDRLRRSGPQPRALALAILVATAACGNADGGGPGSTVGTSDSQRTPDDATSSPADGDAAATSDGGGSDIGIGLGLDGEEPSDVETTDATGTDAVTGDTIPGDDTVSNDGATTVSDSDGDGAPTDTAGDSLGDGLGASDIAYDAGAGPCVPPKPLPIGCDGGCPTGYECIGDACVLRGSDGPLQVTLRWNAPVDLDLHLIEPIAGGVCEIWYGDPNDIPNVTTSICGAVGKLDLDSNSGCMLDGIETENILYPPGNAPPGSYEVRIDFYSDCSTVVPVTFEVEVRIGDQILGFCGQFAPMSWDEGVAGSGVPVLGFSVP